MACNFLVKFSKVDQLHEIANIQLVSAKLETLNKRYFENAKKNENPLIKILLDDYDEICEEYDLNNISILCNLA